MRVPDTALLPSLSVAHPCFSGAPVNVQAWVIARDTFVVLLRQKGAWQAAQARHLELTAYLFFFGCRVFLPSLGTGFTGRAPFLVALILVVGRFDAVVLRDLQFKG